MENIRDSVPGAMSYLFHGAEDQHEEGDYKGPDGLWYCGKCNTRKQSIIHLPAGSIFGDGGDRIVPCQCRCQQEAEEKRKAKERYQEEMIRFQRQRDASLMDRKYREAGFGVYQVTDNNKRALSVARQYVQKFDQMYESNQGIIFYGPVGTGKSYTSACIANALLDRNVSVIMTSFVKILQNIQTQDEAEYIAMLNSAKLLILDDLGTERNTDYALEKVYNIIDSRSRASKPMILTTNLELRDMMEAEDIRYKRIYDRIFETCFPVKIPGESFRRISAEQRFDNMAKLMEE